MTRSLIVLVDMDGILCKCVEKVLRIHAEEAEVHADIDQIKGWHIEEYVAKGELIDPYFNRPGFFRDLEPVEGAVEAMSTLRDRGHDIVIVSAPSGGTSASDKYAWIDEHLPWLGRKNVFMGSRKTLVRGDVLIDDSAATLTAWHAIWRRSNHLPSPLPPLFTIAYPWNEGIPPHVALRAQSWKEPKKAWETILDGINALPGVM